MLLTRPKEATSLRRALSRLKADGPSQFFSALGDPLRLRIVALLCWKQDLCVTDLTELLDISQPLVSHHLRILRQAGVVTVERMGQMQCPRLASARIEHMVMNLLTRKGGE
ncbi:MAG: winged helix-turn-helix transcriptional regulator [Candidatus Kerfeldbacteria bacterium]|nr:winged helix-turn-helix transcriptional regulator [Candidatus Kerfeldbacteria bacterium]